VDKYTERINLARYNKKSSSSASYTSTPIENVEEEEEAFTIDEDTGTESSTPFADIQRSYSNAAELSAAAQDVLNVADTLVLTDDTVTDLTNNIISPMTFFLQSSENFLTFEEFKPLHELLLLLEALAQSLEGNDSAEPKLKQETVNALETYTKELRKVTDERSYELVVETLNKKLGINGETISTTSDTEEKIGELENEDAGTYWKVRTLLKNINRDGLERAQKKVVRFLLESFDVRGNKVDDFKDEDDDEEAFEGDEGDEDNYDDYDDEDNNYF
jgi:hypothetical protein